MSRRIAFPPYRPVPADALFRGGSPDAVGCIATAEPVLQALASWDTVASQYPDLPKCIKATLDTTQGLENVQVRDIGSFFPGMGDEAQKAVNYATANVRFERAFIAPATNAVGDPTGIFGWALSSIVQGEGVYALSAAKFANPKSVYDMVNGVLQRNFDGGVGAYTPPPKNKSEAHTEVHTAAAQAETPPQS